MTDVNVEPDLGRYQDVMTIQRVLHTAKTVAIVLSNGGDVRDYYGEFKVPGPGLPTSTKSELDRSGFSVRVFLYDPL